MLKLVSKYISFEHVAHEHMKAKVEKCKSFEDLEKLFKEERWVMSAGIANLIKADLKKSH